MKLHKPLPEGRTYDQVWNHYLVEKEIASRLKVADRNKRRMIYKTMYDDLFRRVPDHPRLIRRSDSVETRAVTEAKMGLVRRFLRPDSVFLEFAPGDCRLAIEICSHVKKVIAVDISDQRGHLDRLPGSFQLVVYDGFSLDLDDESVDVVFSDQLIEHLHPADVYDHFRLALRILKPGGVYVFSMPNRITGPHDVSAYFSDRPEGFHLKEWTYSELPPLLRDTGFSRWETTGRDVNRPFFHFRLVEKVLSLVPRSHRRLFSKFFDVNIRVAAFKE